jgi:hypothetical protein
MTMKSKPRTTKIQRPAPNAFRKLVPTPAAVQDAVAKIQTIPQPAPLPKTEAETDAVLARVAPPAKPYTWSDATHDLMRDAVDLSRWTGRKLQRLGELVIYSLNVVASHVLAAMLYGISLVVFVLTIWEMWTPAKTIADHTKDYLLLTVGL